MKVMPESPDEDLAKLEKKCTAAISKFGKVAQVEKEPIAFGLTALVFVIIADEARGGTEPLEEALSKIEGVNSAEVIDVRRAVG